MDRLEHLMDLLISDHLTFTDEHKRLLTAQVLLTGTMQALAESQKSTDERMRATDERMRATDERMRATDERLRATDERLNALITVVDGIIRRPGL
jgi:hypothetical protein